MVGYLGCLGKVRDAFNIVMYDSTVVSIKMTLIKMGFLWVAFPSSQFGVGFYV